MKSDIFNIGDQKETPVSKGKRENIQVNFHAKLQIRNSSWSLTETTTSSASENELLASNSLTKNTTSSQQRKQSNLVLSESKSSVIF